MATSIHAYQPLQDENSIRILVLEPASIHNAPLIAKLRHVRLACQGQDTKEEYHQSNNALKHSNNLTGSSQFQYEAVSYAWGDQEPTIPLEINGMPSTGPIMIRPNVDTMLRYLRLPDQQRCLWIDALCINQQDPAEQALQVSHMGEVYREAQFVVVWLGPPADAHDRVDLFFDNLIKHADDPDSKERKSTWNGLRSFLDKTWFKRRWIIQEVILAKQAMMRCGDHSINFMDFAKSIWLIAQRQPYVKNAISSIVSKLWMMYKLRSALVPKVRMDVLRLLVEFSTAQCSDERDRIYALNALTDVQVSVSYTDAVRKVYMDYAKMHLIDRGNLAILNCGGAFRSTDSTMPTWVPDWRNLPGYVPLATELVPPKLEDPKVNEWAAAAIHDTSGKTTLGINGVRLGTVSKVGYGAPFPVWGGDILPLLQDWYSVFERNITKSSRRNGPRDTSADQFIAAVSLGAVSKRLNALSPGHPYLDDPFADDATGVTGILAHLIREARDMNTDAPWTSKDQADLHAAASKIPKCLNDALKNLTYGPSISTFDPRYDASASWGSADHPLTNENPYARNLGPSELTDVLCRTIAGRTCFWTSDGSFGLGPANMEPGDVVVAFPTCPTPYVLRPKSPKSPLAWVKAIGSSGDDEMYKLIGDCYMNSFDAVEVFSNGKGVRRVQIV